jgi:predicted protein tyrosine phosphatase
MRIVIQSYLQASHRLESEPGLWDMILIVDSGIRVATRLHDVAKRFLILQFDDIQAPEPEKRLATSDDIRSALEFAESSTNLMVACRAGQSRSAALAFVIAHHELTSSRAMAMK